MNQIEIITKWKGYNIVTGSLYKITNNSVQVRRFSSHPSKIIIVPISEIELIFVYREDGKKKIDLEDLKKEQEIEKI